jgi:dipeptide/tripeptide permease
MKTRTKSIIKGGLFGGIVYALVMLGFDFIDGKNFNVWKFIFNLSFFGILMGFMIYYNLKKQVEKNKSNKNDSTPER